MKNYYLLLGILIIFSCGIEKKAEQEKMKKEIDSSEVKKEEPVEIIEESSGEWGGSYTGEFGNTMNVNGPSDDGTVNFSILQASETCEGSMIEGEAFLTEENVAHFDSEDGCHVSLTYNDGTIQVKETDCDGYHGAGCGSFDGLYKK